MAEVKWIKITTSMFEDDKVDFIFSLPESDAIFTIWIRLLTMAGKCNAGGYIFLTENIPYTEEMLAHKFKKPINVVKLALETFRNLGMIEIDKNGIYLPNWEKYQNIEGLEKIKEQTRQRVASHRMKQKLLISNVTCNATVTQSNATEVDKEEELELEKENTISPQQIADLYSSICKNLPQIRKLSENRKKKIRTRLKEYPTIETWQELFEKVNKSDFLNGKNDRKWKADFEWLLEEKNLLKVLEGRYDNKAVDEFGNKSNGTDLNSLMY